MPIDTNKIIPNVCKYHNCFDRATHEFTDLKVVKDGEKKSESVTLGHACSKHLNELTKLFKSIYKDD